MVSEVMLMCVFTWQPCLFIRQPSGADLTPLPLSSSRVASYNNCEMRRSDWFMAGSWGILDVTMHPSIIERSSTDQTYWSIPPPPPSHLPHICLSLSLSLSSVYISFSILQNEWLISWKNLTPLCRMSPTTVVYELVQNFCVFFNKITSCWFIFRSILFLYSKPANFM